MQRTIKAMLLPTGTISIEETFAVDRPTPVLVTLLEAPPRRLLSQLPTETTDPLDWPLSEEELAVWDELPKFRAEHPVSFKQSREAPPSRFRARK